MEVLTALCWLIHGSDVTALGDRDFATRDLAHRRLKDAGVMAIPAIRLGLKDANPEAMHRSNILLGRLPTRVELLVWMTLHCRATTDAQLLDVAESMMADGELRAAVYAEVDRLNAFMSKPASRWAELTPYSRRTRVGDAGFVIETARGMISRRSAPTHEDE